MGLDGFSMGNLGLNATLTSAQMANQAEYLAQKDSEIIIKDVEKLEKEQAVKSKEEDEKNQQFNDGFKKNDDEADSEQEDETNSNDTNSNEGITSELIERDFASKDPKEFSVRLNQETDMIELINNKEDKVLETIKAQDLMNMVSKLNSASGILVNRKI